MENQSCPGQSWLTVACSWTHTRLGGFIDCTERMNQQKADTERPRLALKQRGDYISNSFFHHPMGQLTKVPPMGCCNGVIPQLEPPVHNAAHKVEALSGGLQRQLENSIT